MNRQLTPRELEVVEQYMQGCNTTQDVADRLGISMHTAKTHEGAIRRKWNVHSRAAMLAYYWKHLGTEPNAEAPKMGHDPVGRKLTRIADLKEHLLDPTTHKMQESTIENVQRSSKFAVHDTLELIHRFLHYLMQKKYHTYS